MKIYPLSFPAVFTTAQQDLAKYIDSRDELIMRVLETDDEALSGLSLQLSKRYGLHQNILEDVRKACSL